MKTKAGKGVKEDAKLREQIFQSTLSSFKIEGISIPMEQARAIFRKVELSLKK